MLIFLTFKFFIYQATNKNYLQIQIYWCPKYLLGYDLNDFSKQHLLHLAN